MESPSGQRAFRGGLQRRPPTLVAFSDRAHKRHARDRSGNVRRHCILRQFQYALRGATVELTRKIGAAAREFLGLLLLRCLVLPRPLAEIAERRAGLDSSGITYEPLGRIRDIGRKFVRGCGCSQCAGADLLQRIDDRLVQHLLAEGRCGRRGWWCGRCVLGEPVTAGCAHGRRRRCRLRCILGEPISHRIYGTTTAPLDL